MKERIITIFTVTGLTWLVPITRLFTGDSPKDQFKALGYAIGLPVFAFVLFLSFWSVLAPQVRTSLGTLPGPGAVMEQAGVLWHEHQTERSKQASFEERQATRNANLVASGREEEVKIRTFTGRPTFLDQILTSLITVFAGFLLASMIAIPFGILCGMNPAIMTAMNPLIQIFKPVSPLAWLPLITMVVSAVYTVGEGMPEKSFIISALTVTLCSLWPALINTALGVANLDKDYINVSRVLQLGIFTRIFKILLPATLPLIFTGLRISLGVGWMVLIAAEMLAQNPGLGKFVWDEFQNGSANSLSRIMLAVFTIGVIGFILDRIMVTLQRAASFGQGPQAN